MREGSSCHIIFVLATAFRFPGFRCTKKVGALHTSLFYFYFHEEQEIPSEAWI